MNISKIQDLTVELVVNREALAAFKKSPKKFCADHGLNMMEAEYLTGLRLQDLETFRDVIEGTRLEHFGQTFPEAAALLGEEWEPLVLAFHESAVIRSNENQRDMIQFACFAEQKTCASAASSWLWHGILRVMPPQFYGELPKSRFGRVGKNALTVTLSADVTGEPSTKPGTHHFLYVHELSEFDSLNVYEIDEQSIRKLAQSSYDQEMIESLAECGVIL